MVRTVAAHKRSDGCGVAQSNPNITVMLGVGLCWPQVVLWMPLATNGVMFWVLVTKPVVMPGVQLQSCD